jgi:NAD(P)-dependent dehydrogenase (short-subunit alcohol dehydrogenase family)
MEVLLMATEDMKDRHVAILGASVGIGLETARLLADRCARLTVGGRNRQRLDAAVDDLGGRARAVVVDAEDVASLRAFFSEAGPITDLVITVTRRGGAGPVEELVDSDLLGAFAGKTVAHLHAIALGIPTLAQDGSVTMVTAGSAQSALPGSVGLAAVNGALEAAVRPLAAELAPRRVNAVSPGVIETGWWDEVPEEARQGAFASFADRALVKRNGRATDVAQAIVALVENGFITGVVLPCDGGLRLT